MLEICGAIISDYINIYLYLYCGLLYSCIWLYVFVILFCGFVGLVVIAQSWIMWCPLNLIYDMFSVYLWS